jgi:hypothetical protein
MRRRLLIILIFLLAGAVVNVAVAWTCAIKVNPLNGKVKDALENVLGMQGFAVMRFSRSGATLITCYRCNGALHPSDVQGDPAALLDYWTGFHQPTPEYESGTTLKEERIAHGCGWPMLTFWCETYGDLIGWGPFGGPLRGGVDTEHSPWKRDVGRRRSFLTIPAVLPLRPIWPGFVVNTLFYAAILWPLICGHLVPGRFLWRFLRRRRGLCPWCAYPMGESAVCTECGKELPQRAVAI